MSEPRPPSWSHVVATAFFTVVGNLVFVVATFVFSVLASVVGWLPPRGRWMFLCGRIWSPIVLRTAGIRTRVSFAEPLAPDQGFVYMANHQSMMDIPVLLSTLPGETRMLAKAGLFRIPIFGWALSAGGFIPVDRKDRASARETFTAAIRSLEKGRSILVFPEETRSRTEELLPFKSGGFLVALKTGYPIVPVGIRGTLEARPRGSLVNSPQRVEVCYGQPVRVADYGLRGKAQLVDEVRRRILELKATDS